MKKWEDKKGRVDRKIGEYNIFYFLSFVFGWNGGKVEKLKTFLFD